MVKTKKRCCQLLFEILGIWNKYRKKMKAAFAYYPRKAAILCAVAFFLESCLSFSSVLDLDMTALSLSKQLCWILWKIYFLIFSFLRQKKKWLFNAIRKKFNLWNSWIYNTSCLIASVRLWSEKENYYMWYALKLVVRIKTSTIV